jgi:heparan-alpha-glucosaminide N-acetyltransferase
MISLAFGGFGLAGTATNHLKANPDSSFWKAVFHQFEHVEWTGCGFWDLIQPSFMFMVGAAMVYSYARRKDRGDSWLSMFGHASWRGLVLIFLGIFLISNGRPSTEWSLMNVLTQIGLGYPFLFLLWNRSFKTQAIAAASLLVGTWLLFTLYPTRGIDRALGSPEVGVTAAWAAENLKDISPAWHKNANVGHAIDLWLLNLLPQSEPFRFSRGGYQTINFIPSLATMIFGLMAGGLLRSSESNHRKWLWLTAAGVGGLVLGQVLHSTGISPSIKRIWTPSWALFSTGWCLLILATLFGIIDVLQVKRWTFPLIVVGMNSIAIYTMGMLLKPWTRDMIKRHFGKDIFLTFGASWETTVQSVSVGLFFWLICWWMYRQKIFIRI